MADATAIPSPPTNPEVERFMAAAREGKLLYGRCKSCGEAHYYPRALCPFCFGDTEWLEASGEGTIYSFTVLRRARPPYAMSYVALAEGPKMLTHLVDCDFDALRIGQPVRLVFKPSADGQPVPFFTPA